MRVRHAVVPAAGRGTRMAPASLAGPKELFPIGDRPAIQWVIEGAIAAGVKEFAVVSSPAKPGLRAYLEEARHPTLDRLRKRARLRFVEQPEPLGVGDALLRGWQGLGEPEVVAVLMPDMIRIREPQAIEFLLSAYDPLRWPAVSFGVVQSFSERRGDRARHFYRLAPWAPGVKRVVALERDKSLFVGTGTALVTRTFFQAALQLRRSRKEVDDAEVHRALLREKQLLLAIRLSGAPVHDVGNPIGLASAHAAFLKYTFARDSHNGD